MYFSILMFLRNNMTFYFDWQSGPNISYKFVGTYNIMFFSFLFVWSAYGHQLFYCEGNSAWGAFRRWLGFPFSWGVMCETWDGCGRLCPIPGQLIIISVFLEVLDCDWMSCFLSLKCTIKTKKLYIFVIIIYAFCIAWPKVSLTYTTIKRCFVLYNIYNMNSIIHIDNNNKDIIHNITNNIIFRYPIRRVSRVCSIREGAAAVAQYIVWTIMTLLL